MYETLTSKSNEKIKEARKLTEKKYRAQCGLFVLEGRKLLLDYLASGGVPLRIFAADDVSERCRDLAEGSGCRELYSVPRALYMHLSSESAPEGLMALCRIPAQRPLSDGSCLILESVRDAGNLGTAIRTAVAFGMANVVLSADCADIYNPKTLRSAMGALFFANTVISDDLCTFVADLKSKGRRVFAGVPGERALDVRKAALRSGDSLVIGNEGNGVSEELAALCTGLVRVPMGGRTESLNAAAAAAILMWELVRGGEIK